MFIFYDFETSSRESFGQILSYCFIAVTPSFEVIEECSGMIQLNRTEIPDIDALLTNKLDLNDLKRTGLSEIETAKKIYSFLSRLIYTAGSATLVGFNSNSFDLTFLRNLLIGYGYNPYFSGSLHNLDLLHFSQYVAFNHPEHFPWVLAQSETSNYYSFKLEDIAHGFSLLDGTQTHDARDDVILSITLAQTLEHISRRPLSHFKMVDIGSSPEHSQEVPIYQQKTRHFSSDSATPKKWELCHFFPVSKLGKSFLLIDLNKLQTQINHNVPITDDLLLSSIRYINPNKHFFHATPLDSHKSSEWEPIITAILDIPLFKEIQNKPDCYFEKTKKDWDIQYQIHELGFERIDTLRQRIAQLIASPESYTEILNGLLKTRKDLKDTHLIRLFNRAYLKLHPNPDPKDMKRYLEQRYIQGKLHRNPEDFTPLSSITKRLESLIHDSDTTEADVLILNSLRNHIERTQQSYMCSQ